MRIPSRKEKDFSEEKNMTAIRNWKVLSAALLALAAAWSVLSPKAALAQDYPNRPIKMVVGFPPGGSNDVVARIIAPKMAELLGQPVVVDNRPGANATVGTDLVAKSAPDGYTITLGSLSPLVISLVTYANIPYNTATDFVPINTVALTPEVIAVHPSSPAKSLQELVALSKKGPITLSSSGNGGLPHLAIELLKRETKGDFLHVPYKGAGPAVVDTLGGHVNGVVMDLPAVGTQVKEGKLRGLAVTGRSRAAVLPDLPTAAEQGLPGVYAVNWFALMAPKGTPAAIVTKLNDALLKALAMPEVKDQFAKAGVEEYTQPSPVAMRKFLDEEIARWGKIARDAGAKAD
jgi:tripartite-type tricarboxylate transporter receptor subunit TctC